MYKNSTQTHGVNKHLNNIKLLSTNTLKIHHYKYVFFKVSLSTFKECHSCYMSKCHINAMAHYRAQDEPPFSVITHFIVRSD